jgi:hypothetical protein
MAIVTSTTTRGGSVNMSSGTSTTRQTPSTSFGSMVRGGVATGAGAAAGAAAVAAPFVPGGAVVSAAVNGGANAMGMGADGNYAGGVQGIPGNGPGLGGAGGGMASTGNGQQDMMNNVKQMQEMQMSFSMQYLGLQEKMQNENRQYTTVSNVLKTKHDTVKNSINNVR